MATGVTWNCRPNIFNELTEATVEGWVKWRAFRGDARFFDFGKEWQGINVGAPTIGEPTGTLRLQFHEASKNVHHVRAPGLLRLNEWVHVAAVSGRGGAKLYLNGALVASNPFAGSFAAIKNGDHNYLGRNNWIGDPGFARDSNAQMDEVRVWKVIRTAKDIRENLLKKLTGTEPDLVGLWNFDDPANPGRDASLNHHDGKLMGNARVESPSVPVAAVQSPPPFAGPSNRVLQLDGNDSYLQLPPDIIRGLEELTVEGWARWDEFRFWSRSFSFGEGDYRFGVTNVGRTGNIWAGMDLGRTAGELVSPGISTGSNLAAGQWVHVALVAGADGMSLYVNGTLAGKQPQALISKLRGDSENRLGGGDGVPPLCGALDEIRVWNVGRTAEQIRENLLKQLTGSEPGLVGLWNFDDPANPGRDASPNHYDGKLIRNARTVSAANTTTPLAGGGLSLGQGNKILTLDDTTSYVQLPPRILDGLSALTIEGWARWDSREPWAGFIRFGAAPGVNHKLVIYTSSHTPDTLRLTIDDMTSGEWSGRFYRYHGGLSRRRVDSCRRGFR
jgi:hypothetical protein